MRARELATITGTLFPARVVRFASVLPALQANAVDISELRFRDTGDQLITPVTWTRVNQGSEAAFTSFNFSDGNLSNRAAYWATTIPANFYFQADFGTIKTVKNFWQACYSNSAGSTTVTAPNAQNELNGRWLRGATVSTSLDGVNFTSMGPFIFSNPGIGTQGPLEELIGEEPDFGESIRGELAVWNDAYYGCVTSGNPGEWVTLN
jgi:hypothetical protein